jgi:aspartyl-tRNA(Asn)/glutamyl-tRNA(Gln) amidotransferase subunit A
MLKELRAQLDSKAISSVELTQQYLRTIEQTNPKLNAYVSVLGESALAQAKVADTAIAAGHVTALTGIPYALKDVYAVSGQVTTGGSNILRDYQPPYTATTVERLRGAVLLGKTNCDEFAMGASTENSCFGVTRNPHDTSRVAGGSSGGSAAAVAADLAPFALGTDTGGSIRQPSSYCGVVGIRPTYGRVSRYGVFPMASSMDTMGPFGKTVEDVALVLEQMAGRDWHDSTTVDRPVEPYTQLLDETLKPLTIGVAKEYYEAPGLDDAVRAVSENVIKQLQQAGHTIKQISMPHTRYAVPAYYIIVPSEVSANLARFDGIKYGYHATAAADLTEVYMKSRGQGFGNEAKRRIMIGTYTLSAGYVDAYYVKAMKVRTLVRQDFTQAFKDVDVLIGPSSPGVAFPVGEKEDPIDMYLEDIFTAPASLAGVPGLVVPAGQINRLPVGVQIMGPQWSEALVLRVGRLIERLSGR